MYLTQGSFDASSSANNIVPNHAANLLSGDSSTIYVPFIQGEYTGLLLGAERAAGLSCSSRRLDFEEAVILRRHCTYHLSYKVENNNMNYCF